MIPLNVLLSHYKRRDIQEEMLLHTKSREMAVRFGDRFGSRPDMLNAASDILEYAKQGATSFHCSEELWRNPLQLKSEMGRQEQDNLRSGWDLVIDVDCPVWEYSKLITHFIIQALRENGVSSISCKFSGNKGFHIGVPFEAFPQKAGGKETRLQFPDGVRIIASYLVSEIDKERRFTDFIFKKGLLELLENMGMERSELVKIVCARCEAQKVEEKEKFEFICPFCQRRDVVESDDVVRYCSRCKKLMQRSSLKRNQAYFREQTLGDFKDVCIKCREINNFRPKFQLNTVLNIDSVLISSRHLYRMPYSLHEKSGLVSIPINPDEILKFEREMAKPEHLVVSTFRFLDRENVHPGNAKMLFDNAKRWDIQKTGENDAVKNSTMVRREYILTEAIPQDLFPPCIKLILNGLVDGRKRAVFILINFWRSVGYDYAAIETMLNEWNKKNPEPLREINIKNPLAYHKQQNKQALPPNCQNAGYMLAMGVCKPDHFCATIKNPAQYSKKKAWLLQQGTKGKNRKKAEKA